MAWPAALLRAQSSEGGRRGAPAPAATSCRADRDRDPSASMCIHSIKDLAKSHGVLAANTYNYTFNRIR